MGAGVPVDHLVVRAASLADELAFVALADLGMALSGQEQVEYRLIGGIMVNLHAQRWKLGPLLYRQTGDADLGVPPAVVQDAEVLVRLGELGYEKVAGNRFERRLDPGPLDPGAEGVAQRVAAIDVLVPAYTSRARENVQVGQLQTTEVRGLAFAFNRPALRVDLEMTMMDGETLRAEVLLPDEASAIVLRAYAWHVRGAGTDAVDLWRALEIASAAGLQLRELGHNDPLQAREIIRRAFVSPARALDALQKARGLSREERTRMGTRLRALTSAVVGES